MEPVGQIAVPPAAKARSAVRPRAVRASPGRIWSRAGFRPHRSFVGSGGCPTFQCYAQLWSRLLSAWCAEVGALYVEGRQPLRWNSGRGW